MEYDTKDTARSRTREFGGGMPASLVRGATKPPLLETTIGDALAAAVTRWPDRDALISRHQNVRWSYAEFGQRVDRLAAGFLALGLARGDRVGIWAPNCA